MGSYYVLVRQLSRRDLLQGIREAAKTEDLVQVQTARLERDGRISVVLKKKTGQDARS